MSTSPSWNGFWAWERYSIETAGETSRLTMAGVAQPQEVADYILEAIRK